MFTSPAGVSRAARPATVFLAAAVLATACAVGVAVLAGTRPYGLLGVGDPGLLVRLGTPALRLGADVAGTVCVGAAAFATWFASPHQAPTALRAAGHWATAWCLCAALLVPFTSADETGLPLTGPPDSVTVSTPASAVSQWAALEQPLGWLVAAVLALLVALACRLATRPAPVCWLALLAITPPLATGHSSAGRGHDLATTAILVHVPAAMVWLGVLVALLRYGHVHPGRYRRLASVCWLVLAGSGLVDAAVLVPSGLGSAYGRLLAVKIVLVAALGATGAVVRRRLVAVRKLAAAELVLLAATLGLSVGLTHLQPPVFTGPAPSLRQTLLGYDLAGPPTPVRLLVDWRVDLLFGPLAVLLAAGYLVAVRRLRRTGEPWPAGRTAAWLAGCLVLLVASSSGIGRYAPAMFSIHLTAHMLIAMLAPVLLALGGPLTLVDAVAPNAARPLHGRTARVLTHPLVILPLFTGAPFVLYFTGLFDLSARFHWAGLLVDLVFVSIGYLFAWSACGVDATPGELPAPARLGLLLAAMPMDIVFGATVLSSRTVLGDGPGSADLYSSLALPWVPDLLADQRAAGVAALVLGEAALLVAAVALVVRWRRYAEHSDDLAVAFGHTRLG